MSTHAQPCRQRGHRARAVQWGRGPARGVLRAPDCEDAPRGALLLDVEHALDIAENPGAWLCTLCGGAAVL
ncbi:MULTISPECIES: DUF6233 domain-containing protein [Streptomyces]|uniref:DUF6233 domain-containing protein n=1 Tax=Streptomyces TaxID=1883 RepID=UPI00227D916D|nr:MULTISPECIES: DUF6233 domain-containing protein [Streptomyces]